MRLAELVIGYLIRGLRRKDNPSRLDSASWGKDEDEETKETDSRSSRKPRPSALAVGGWQI